MNNYRSFLLQDFAEKLAKSESSEHYNNSFKKDLSLYDNDKQLMFKHYRFIKYIYSTFPKYIIHRNIIIYYYKSLKCSISTLNRSVDISRTSLKKIIDDSIEEGWISTRVDMSNKRQILISPTELELNFGCYIVKKKFVLKLKIM